MSLSINDRRTSITATNGQTLFTPDFPLFQPRTGQPEEVRVKQTPIATGIEATLDPSAYTVTLGTPGEYPSTFTITLDAAAALNDIIVIEGAREIRSPSAFSTGGDFTAEEVNLRIDETSAERQEIARDVVDLEEAIDDITGVTGDLTEGYLPVAQDSGDATTLVDSIISESGGAITVAGSLTANDLHATDDLTVGDNAVIDGAMTVGETLGVDGDAVVGGNVVVTGSVTAEDGHFTDDLEVGDDVAVAGNIDVEGIIQAGPGDQDITTAAGDIIIAAFDRTGSSQGYFLIDNGTEMEMSPKSNIDANSNQLIISAHRDSASTKGMLKLRGSRGTEASPSPLLDDDIIGRLDIGEGHGSGVAGEYIVGASVRSVADGNWSDSSAPTRIEYYVCQTGSTTLTLAYTINSTLGVQYEGDLNVRGTFVMRVGTQFSAADTTPSVGTGNIFKLASSGTQTITQFDNGHAGQILLLIATASGTTVQNNANINIGADWVPAAGDTLFLTTDNGTEWYRMGANEPVIAADSITNAMLDNMATLTIKGNDTGGSANPQDLTVAEVKTMLAIANTDVSGLGTMSTQNANAVAITGGAASFTGDLAVSGAGVNTIWKRYLTRADVLVTETAGITTIYGTTPAGGPTEREIGTSGNVVGFRVSTIDFDGTNDEYCHFVFRMPDDYDGRAIRLRIDWTALSGSGDVRWLAYMKMYGDGGAFGANTLSVTSTDTVLSTSQLHTIVTSTFTPNTSTDGDYAHLVIRRNASNGGDTLDAVDAHLIGVGISY
jgi:hypothetical protein